jgi:hypothetical protein
MQRSHPLFRIRRLPHADCDQSARGRAAANVGTAGTTHSGQSARPLRMSSSHIERRRVRCSVGTANPQVLRRSASSAPMSLAVRRLARRSAKPEGLLGTRLSSYEIGPRFSRLFEASPSADATPRSRSSSSYCPARCLRGESSVTLCAGSVGGCKLQRNVCILIDSIIAVDRTSP